MHGSIIRRLQFLLLFFLINLHAQNTIGINGSSLPFQLSDETTDGQIIEKDSSFAISSGFWLGLGVGANYYGLARQAALNYRYKKHIFLV